CHKQGGFNCIRSVDGTGTVEVEGLRPGAIVTRGGIVVVAVILSRGRSSGDENRGRRAGLHDANHEAGFRSFMSKSSVFLICSPAVRSCAVSPKGSSSISAFNFANRRFS